MTDFGYGMLFGYVLGVFSGPVAVFVIAFYFSRRAETGKAKA